MSLYFDASKAHPCERLARITGQSNFLPLLGDLLKGGPRKEAIAADTTEDMAALAMIRRGAIPESLEAYWGGSTLHRYALCQCVLDALLQDGALRERDVRWARGAILDAFDMFHFSAGPNARERALHFRVRYGDYLDARGEAERLFRAIESDARPRWIRARLRP